MVTFECLGKGGHSIQFSRTCKEIEQFVIQHYNYGTNLQFAYGEGTHIYKVIKRNKVRVIQV